MRLHVSFNLYLPEGTSQQHVHEWIGFQLGARVRISADNPLMGKPIEATDIDWEER